MARATTGTRISPSSIRNLSRASIRRNSSTPSATASRVARDPLSILPRHLVRFVQPEARRFGFIGLLRSCAKRQPQEDSERQGNPKASISLMFSQNVREAPDFVEGIIKWRGRGADDVWFAEIAFHAGGFEFFEKLLRMLLHLDRELATPLTRLAWRDHSELRMLGRLDQELEISG